jgi:hypothetical protein
MTDAGFDRRLRDWLHDRDPGPVPTSLRASVSRVPAETPVPPLTRLWRTIVGPGDTGRNAPALRLAVLLAVLGALVALATAGFIAVTSRPQLPTAWRSYVVGLVAPDVDFGSVAGTLQHGDPTISVDDLPGSVVVLYFPGNVSAEKAAADAQVLVGASEQTPAGTAFLVVSSATSPIGTETIDRLHEAGMLTARPPGGWEPATKSEERSVLVVTNRAGVVKYVFAGDLPDADELIGDLDRASLP